MDIVKKIKNYMTPFQWAEVLIVIGFTIYFAAIDTKNTWWYILLNSLAAICGIFCVVLCAAGKKSQYYWGFVNIIGYIVVSWVSKYYGQVMLNALYYLPTQFIGLYMWNKHLNEDKEKVKSKKMTPALLAAYTIGSLALIWVYHLLLKRMGGNATLLDSATTTISLVANALMVLRYREQWVLWIIVDVITVILWIIAKDLIMTTMWAVYLINAFYGFYMWSKMNKENAANE